MRRAMAVVLLTAVVSIFCICRDLSVGAQAVPPTCGDINGDGSTDISDAAYLLNHLFTGGPPPTACAASPGLEARVAALEDDLEASAFGRRVAGTYSAAFPAGALQVRMLLTFSADGTLMQSSQMDHGWLGEGLPPAPAAWTSRGPVHGAWRRTGERELAACVLEFLYDEQGLPSSAAKGQYVLHFDETFGEYEADWSVDYYAAGADPLDPGAQPIGGINGISSGRRLPCE